MFGSLLDLVGNRFQSSFVIIRGVIPLDWSPLSLGGLPVVGLFFCMSPYMLSFFIFLNKKLGFFHKKKVKEFPFFYLAQELPLIFNSN